MALEEKVNNVKYQGRDDYRVVYFDVTEEGNNVKYFFLNQGANRLKNGNIIATTNLKVAINASKPEEAASIGVVSPEGKVVIPFTNRKIKMIDDNTLLVEPDAPVSENVIKAIGDRNQPQEATRLVSSANRIKEKVNNSMNGNGRFIFNDLFSEATIYDINGNNLVNNEYYSFIGVGENMSLFLCKNDPASDVMTLALTNENQVENNVAAEEVVPEESVDVSAVNLPENVVDEAFNNQVQEEVSEQPPMVEADAEVSTEEVVPETPVQEETVAVEQPMEETAPAVEEMVTETPVQEEQVVVEQPLEEIAPATEEIVAETPVQEEQVVAEQPMEETAPATEEIVAEAPVQEEQVVAEETPVGDNEIVETTEYIPEDTKVEEVAEEAINEVPMDIGEEDFDITIDSDEEFEDEDEQELKLDLPQDEDIDLEEDVLEKARVKVDSIDRGDIFDNFVEEKDFGGFGFAESKEIIDSIANTLEENTDKIKSLERQLAEEKEINAKKTKENESLKEENYALEKEKTRLEDVTRDLSKENESLKEENSQLEDKGNYYRKAAISLAKENDQLNERVDEYEKIKQEIFRGFKKYASSEERDFEEEIKQKVA